MSVIYKKNVFRCKVPIDDLKNPFSVLVGGGAGSPPSQWNAKGSRYEFGFYLGGKFVTDISDNLSDVASVASARGNLGVNVLTNGVARAPDTNFSPLTILISDGNNATAPGLNISWPGILDSVVDSPTILITNATGTVLLRGNDNGDLRVNGTVTGATLVGSLNGTNLTGKATTNFTVAEPVKTNNPATKAYVDANSGGGRRHGGFD